MLPSSILDRYRRFKRFRGQARNRHKSTEEVFTEIYATNQWGGVSGEFSSGSGTRDKQIVAAYVEMIRQIAAKEHFSDLAFVDLGCGDFGVGQHLVPLCATYIGVDIVAPVVRQNEQRYGNVTTRFIHLNMITDELPDGDVCFVRQVLQHLSNQQILSVLGKLGKYSRVFITEHYPTDNDAIQVNIDKVQGGDVRVYDNSGVYLTEHPFLLPPEAIQLLLEVPGAGMGENRDPGVIRTYLYKPSGHSS